MEHFIQWVFDSFYSIIETLTTKTIFVLFELQNNVGSYDLSLDEIDFNLLLFSETPILSTNLADFLTIFFSIFYTVIFIVIVWKIIKRLFNRLFRWGY